MELMNVELPTHDQFGIFQIKGLNATFFRFSVEDGHYLLEPHSFIVTVSDPDKRQELMSQAMYDDLQRALDENVPFES
ncbi:hypothetical protein [Lacticaseibacillus paracasei]|uniref:hypothetical protein n=1 Tax=Lacticaseibacillus paracasei TaxID=1597 RepID=UPI00189865BA|nr:hypothetical protein [Lacticaseibacillus paracasei]